MEVLAGRNLLFFKQEKFISRLYIFCSFVGSYFIILIVLSVVVLSVVVLSVVVLSVVVVVLSVMV